MILVEVKRKKRGEKEEKGEREHCAVRAHWRDSRKGKREEEEEGRTGRVKWSVTWLPQKRLQLQVEGFFPGWRQDRPVPATCSLILKKGGGEEVGIAHSIP